MVSVSDNLGAITNATSSVTVVPYSADNLDEYLDSIQQIYQNALQLTTDQQIQYLNLVTLDYTLFDANSVASCQQSGSCNSRGQCLSTANNQYYCQCQEQYYLRDCSATQSQYTTYLQTKKNIYDTMNTLQNLSSTKAIQEQVVKSVNLLLQQNDLGQLLTQSEADSAIVQIGSLIEIQNQQLSQFATQGMLNQGDSQTTRATQTANAILGKSLYNMIGTFSTAMSSANALYRGLTFISVNQSFTQIFNLTLNVSAALQTATLPNADPVIYNGSNFAQSVQVSTTKTVQALFVSNDYQLNNLYYERDYNSSKINLNSTFDSQSQNSSSTSVYKLSQRAFGDNPLKYDKLFPYPEQSSQLISIDIQSDASNSSNENLNITESLPMTFPAVQSNNGSANNPPMVCIGLQSNGTWSNKYCQTQQNSASQQLNTTTQCLCQSLGPTTVISDVENLFVNSNLGEIFSSEGFSALKEFPIYKSYIFYIFCVSTLFLIISGVYGYRIDIKLNTQIQPAIESIVRQPAINISIDQQKQTIDKNLKLCNSKSQILQTESNNRRSISMINSGRGKINDQDTLASNNIISINKICSESQLDPIKDENFTNRESVIIQNPTKKDNMKKSQEIDGKKKPTEWYKMAKYYERNHLKADINTMSQISSSSSHIDVDEIFNKKKSNLQNELNSIIVEEDVNLDSRSEHVSQKTEIHPMQQKITDNATTKIIKNAQKKRSVAEGIVRLHELFGIYLIYDNQLSRPSRFTLYYLKIVTLITLSAVFTQQINFIQSFAASVFSALFLGLPLALFETMLQHSNRFLQALGVIMIMFFLALNLYVSLANAALMGVDESNAWAQSYSASYLFSTFMTNPLVTLLKLLLVKKFIDDDSTTSKIIKIIGGELTVKYFSYLV